MSGSFVATLAIIVLAAVLSYRNVEQVVVSDVGMPGEMATT